MNFTSILSWMNQSGSLFQWIVPSSFGGWIRLEWWSMINLGKKLVCAWSIHVLMEVNRGSMKTSIFDWRWKDLKRKREKKKSGKFSQCAQLMSNRPIQNDSMRFSSMHQTKLCRCIQKATRHSMSVSSIHCCFSFISFMFRLNWPKREKKTRRKNCKNF